MSSSRRGWKCRKRRRGGCVEHCVPWAMDVSEEQNTLTPSTLHQPSTLGLCLDVMRVHSKISDRRKGEGGSFVGGKFPFVLSLQPYEERCSVCNHRVFNVWSSSGWMTPLTQKNEQTVKFRKMKVLIKTREVNVNQVPVNPVLKNNNPMTFDRSFFPRGYFNL